ncbi:glycosyltransferase family 4 protein [Microbacterium hominis]|uniref:Glycosyltransferase family 4 protein n=1 Tax=Microbacterium hominis TaxID=162426 RepID=A0A7D4TPD3_9MICO|nr:glycosyltransferase family 4 protein [Microbacterium hominis]QKJ20282.1 glycosyltransferase family 4 protein [Microbacterium hominis]
MRAGVRVHVVAASIVRPVEGAASTRSTLAVGGRRIPHRALGRDRALRYHDYVASLLVRKKDVDVVHAWPLASERTFLAARRRGIPGLREVPNTHTAHAYEVVAAEYAALGLTPRAGASHTADAKRLATEEREWEAATALLVPSDAVARTFLDRGFDPRRLLRTQYGCTIAELPARDAPGAASRPFTAVFLGRGDPRKGLHTALRAWRDSAAAQTGRFLVYGALDPDYAAHLAPLLDHPGVEVRGVTTDPLAALATADVMLLPSIEEGSALVTYEAQVAGCVPLVSTAAGALLEEGVTGLTHEVGDVATLTRHLDLLVAQPEVRETMSAAAQAAADQLSWAAAAERLIEAYEVAAALRDPARGSVRDHAPA